VTKWVLTAGGCLLLPGVVLSGLAVLISSSTGYDHASQGWIIAGLLAFVGGLWLLRRIVIQATVPMERPRWGDNREPPPPPPPQGVPERPPPEAAGSKHVGLWVMGCLVAIVLMFAAFPLVIFLADTSVRDSHQSQAPDTTEPTHSQGPNAIELGTGGVNCSLATSATTFSTHDRIRVAAYNVPGAGDVAFRLVQYGKVLAGYPVIRPTNPTSGCVYEELPPLPVGHYEVWISMAAGPIDPALFLGDFNVTP
jgi:hypothetical protein